MSEPVAQMWIDLETTGLDPQKHSVVEVAVAFTHVENRKLVVEYEASAILAPTQDSWSTFCIWMHMRTGLLQEVHSGHGRPADIFWKELTTKLEEWKGPREVVLAGRSVHFDRSFLRVVAPDLEAHLHHRHLDVSAVEMFLGHAGMNTRDLNRLEGVPHRARYDLQSAMHQYGWFLNQLAP